MFSVLGRLSLTANTQTSFTLPTNLALLSAPRILEAGLLVMSHEAPLRVCCCLHCNHTPSQALQRRRQDVNSGLMTAFPLRILESCELTLLGTIRFLLPLITLSILTSECTRRRRHRMRLIPEETALIKTFVTD